LNRLEAKKLWRTNVDKWQSWTLELIREISQIEDPPLRHAVASILDVIASGFGHLAVQRTEKDKLHLLGFVLEAEMLEGLNRGLKTFGEEVDPEEVSKQAAIWLKQHIKGVSAVQLAWCVGPLRDTTPVALDNKGRVRQITMEHIIYDFTKECILGVKLDDGGIYKPPT
jgi:hypothetical protein